MFMRLFVFEYYSRKFLGFFLFVLILFIIFAPSLVCSAISNSGLSDKKGVFIKKQHLHLSYILRRT